MVPKTLSIRKSKPIQEAANIGKTLKFKMLQNILESIHQHGSDIEVASH